MDVKVQISAGDSVSGLLQMPERPFACFVLAHGAGAGMTHKFMTAVAEGLGDRGMATLRYQFPYMEHGSKRPDRPAIAHAAVRAAVAAAASLMPGLPLIAGGKSKGTEFSELGKVISSRTKAVVLIGEAAEEIGKHVKRAQVAHAGSMDEAVATASAFAESGDVVLLSPACASFDMFASAEARGEAFVAAVTGAQHVR